MPNDVIVSLGFEDDGAEAGLSRIGQAFERWEQHEPTRFIRGTSFALEELALKATDAAGPLGRLGEMFLLMGVGGTWGLAALAGIAAIGAATKAMGEEAEQAAKYNEHLAESLQKVWHQATISPATERASDIQAVNTQRAQAQRELDRLLTMQRAGSTSVPVPSAELDRWDPLHFMQQVLGGRPIQQAIDEARSRVATLTAEARGLTGGPVGLSPISVESNIYDEIGAPVYGIGASRFYDWTYRQRFGGAGGGGVGFRFPSPSVFTAPGGLNQIPAFGTTGLNATVGGGGTAGELERVESILSGIRTPLERYRDDMQAIQKAYNDHLITFDRYKQGMKDVQDAMDRVTEKSSSRLAATLVAGGLGVAGALRQGDAGGALTALGSLGTTLGTLKDIPGLQDVGLAATAVGGLISLFSSGKAKVTIADLDAIALTKFKEVRGDPLSSAFIVLNSNDPRALQYKTGRLASRGALPRFP